jgi:hypothetical protein|tara:strand:- start:6353 stop:8476 length:2124 start_codon:yes stop_codon:yes gene_type:complete
MAVKTPIRTVFDGSNNATGLAEFQSGEFIGLTHGGIGASLSIGSAGQVLKVNSGASALEFGTVEAVLNIDGMTDGSSVTIVDGDDFAMSDGGTEKKVNASQIATYVQSEISSLPLSQTALSAGTGITLSTNTLNVDAAQTGITSLLATDIKIGEDDQTKIDFETADEIHFYAANAEQVFVSDGVFGPQTDSDVDLGTTSARFKDAYIDSLTTTANAAVGGNLTVTGDFTVNGTTTTVNSSVTTVDDPVFTLGGDSAPGSDDNKDRGIEFRYHTGSAAKIGFFGFDDSTGKFTFIPDASNSSEVFSGTAGTIVATTFEGNLTGNVTGNTSGTAATVTGAAQSSITSLGTLTTLTVDSVIVNGATIGHTDDTDLITLADGIATVAGELSVTTLDIGGTNVTSTAAELNLVDGITAGTVIASKAIITDSNKDITGGRNITISGELDAATLDISGNADIDGTLEADAITIGGVTLAETISDTVGAMVSSNTETNITVSYDDADNTLDFVIGTLNQDTTGNAGTATTLETARTIAGQSFNGSANIAIASTDLSNTSAIALLTASQTMTNKTLTSPQINTQIDMLARAEMRFQDASGGQYVALEAPATVSSNVTFTLPAADGDADQFIKTDGSGALSFGSVGQQGFVNSTLTTTPGNVNFDLAKSNNTGSAESGFETGALDVFGVAIGFVFDAMEPIGASTDNNLDLGQSDSI